MKSIFNRLLKIDLPFYNSLTKPRMGAGMDYYIKQLNNELSNRCERNSRYSVRAFARALQIDPGALSRILSGKQIPSYKLTQNLMESLKLDPSEQDKFLNSVAQSQRERGISRLHPMFSKKNKRTPKISDLSIDLYRIIADWYHFTIMELTTTEEFDPSPHAIAKELGISITEVKLALERLIRLELLENKDGGYVRTEAQLSTTDKHITTPALKKNQRQFLEKAIESLENDPIEERNMSSMTMAIDPKKLPQAKQMIRDFNQFLCSFLESGEKKQVYNMSIAIFPLQKIKEL